MRPINQVDPNPEPPRPASIRVAERDGAITASWSWFDFQSIVHVTIGVACLLVGTRPVFGGGDEATSAVGVIGAVVFGLAGLLLTYSGLAQLLNRTTVTASRGEIAVSIGPLPWPGAGVWTTAGTQRLFVAETEWQLNYRNWYKVMAISRGTRVQVGHAVQDAAMARWLVWLVESQAGVPHSKGNAEAES